MTSHLKSLVQHFNSIMVQLKHEVADVKATVSTNFNSIMVQLKLLTPSRILFSLIKFQFHNGTIKTIYGKERNKTVQISIP